MALYFKVIHPVQKKGKVYLPGETIQLTEEAAKHIKHCLQPIELTETPVVAITNSDKTTSEPIAEQVATPMKVETAKTNLPAKEGAKKNGNKSSKVK